MEEAHFGGMMKTLIFFRHAKSDWDSNTNNDHSRPLAARGRKAARLMGRLLSRSEQVPEKVLTSSAERARTTLELAVEAGGWKSRIETTGALYDTSPPAVLKIIQATSDEVSSLMLVGHEPTWSRMIEELIGGEADIRFPTAAMAQLDLAVESWKRVEPGCGRLIWLIPPRLLSGSDF